MRKVVVVEWGDAFIDTDDFEPKDAQDTGPVVRSTVGFFIAKNQHGLVLATDVYKKKSDGASTKMFIPNGMIYKVREYICGVQS